MDLTPRDRRKQDLRCAYDQDAARRNDNELAAWRRRIIDELAERVVARPGRRVVDLGCGAGQAAAHLAAADLEVVGVDLSPEMAARTRERGVATVVADLGRLPFADGVFAGALAFNSFLHTPRSEFTALVSEVRRVLAPHAPLTVVVWGGETREGPLDDDWLHPPTVLLAVVGRGPGAPAAPGLSPHGDPLPPSRGDAGPSPAGSASCRRGSLNPQASTLKPQP